MADTATPSQEPRTSVVPVAVTATEKQAVRAVASVLKISDSELLRTHTIDEVMERHARIERALAGGSI